MKKEISSRTRVSTSNRVRLWTRRSRAGWVRKGEERGQPDHPTRRGAIRPWNHVVQKQAENPGPGSPLRRFSKGSHSLWSLREALAAARDKDHWRWDSRGRIRMCLKKSGKVSSKGVDRLTGWWLTVGPLRRVREGREEWWHCPARGPVKNRLGRERVLASSTWMDPVIRSRRDSCSPGTTAALWRRGGRGRRERG